MNYALAKQLVEAGFPHKESDWDGVGCVPNIGAHSPTKPYWSGFSLEELIMACKRIQFRIVCYPHGYVIQRFDWPDMKISPTPSEAVANLWLALNKKI